MIQLKEVEKIYTVGKETVEALKKVSLTIKDGEFVVIVGPSGSGKSTLLHLIGGLDRATSGQVEVHGKNIQRFNDRQLSNYRNKEIGFVFQDFCLQPHLTILENVQIPLTFSQSKHWKEPSAKKKATELLISFGLEARLQHKPTEISGGQKQRVAISRALINKPKILLADEPTGNLDSVTGKKIIHLLQEIHKSQNMTMIIVTHDREVAKYAERIIEIKDGKLVEKNRFEKFIG